MHWNENGNKEQATREDGVKRYKIAFPKQKEGGHVVKKILKESTYGKFRLGFYSTTHVSHKLNRLHIVDLTTSTIKPLMVS